jgi:hypothetical protein
MVAYNFDPRFVAAILDGRKRQTIRPNRIRARHARVGGDLQLYTGMRTPHCRLLLRATCIEAAEIGLDFRRLCVAGGGRLLANLDELDRFAQADGFAEWRDLRAWFAARYDDPPHFHGVLIRWSIAGGTGGGDR